MKDQLSAFMDGELAVESAEHIVTSIKAGGDLKLTWQHYHMIGDTMRGDLAMRNDFCESVMRAIDREPVQFSKSVKTDSETDNQTESIYKKPWFANKLWPVAASIAAMMFVGLMVLQQQFSGSEELSPVEIANSMPLDYVNAHQSSAPSGSAYFMQDASFVEPKK